MSEDETEHVALSARAGGAPTICLMGPVNHLWALNHDPEPKGVGKDDPETTGMYLSDWELSELTELGSGRQCSSQAVGGWT
jgi:hypothetical protein